MRELVPSKPNGLLLTQGLSLSLAAVNTAEGLSAVLFVAQSYTSYISMSRKLQHIFLCDRTKQMPFQAFKESLTGSLKNIIITSQDIIFLEHLMLEMKKVHECLFTGPDSTRRS